MTGRSDVTNRLGAAGPRADRLGGSTSRTEVLP